MLALPQKTKTATPPPNATFVVIVTVAVDDANRRPPVHLRNRCCNSHRRKTHAHDAHHAEGSKILNPPTTLRSSPRSGIAGRRGTGFLHLPPHSYPTPPNYGSFGLLWLEELTHPPTKNQDAATDALRANFAAIGRAVATIFIAPGLRPPGRGLCSLLLFPRAAAWK